MPGEKKQAWTLVELLIVVVIIGILASLALPNYKKMREGTYDREAIANLKLIAAAEKVYRLELGVYIDATDTNDVNNKLKLSLPTTAQAAWDHKVDHVTRTTFTGKGKRKADDNRVWFIDQSLEEPYSQSSGY
ncbi:MAG: type II secretion system protein [Candidatus Omnitrophica bacterium]|nr:type II secretion system protein [Candidatus Omnitrophota bacterium]